MRDWKVVHILQKKYRDLIETGDAPKAIAAGMAWGVFLGFTPLWGLKTLLSLGGAWAMRWNRAAAVIGVTLHDIATPLVPVIIEVEMLIGERVLGRHGEAHAKLFEILHHPKELLHWTTFIGVGQPLLVGSLVLGIPVALAFYFFLYASISAEKKRVTKKIARESAEDLG